LLTKNYFGVNTQKRQAHTLEESDDYNEIKRTLLDNQIPHTNINPALLHNLLIKLDQHFHSKFSCRKGFFYDFAKQFSLVE